MDVGLCCVASQGLFKVGPRLAELWFDKLTTSGYNLQPAHPELVEGPCAATLKRLCVASSQRLTRLMIYIIIHMYQMHLSYVIDGYIDYSSACYIHAIAPHC